MTFMPVLHVVMAVLASWRIVDLSMDRITEGLRKRYPHYLWTCSRCLSVWAGALAVIVFYVSPWLNWPLALSWLYISGLEYAPARRARRITIELLEDEQVAISVGDVIKPRTVQILSNALKAIADREAQQSKERLSAIRAVSSGRN